MDKQTHFNVWYFIVAFVAILLFQSWLSTRQQVETIPFSQFEQMLKDGEISAVNVHGNYLDGTLAKPPAKGPKLYSTVLVQPDIYDLLKKYNVKVTGVVESHFISDILSWVLPAVIFVGIWMFAIRRMGGAGGMGGLMAIGKSKAKIFVEKDTKSPSPMSRAWTRRSRN